MALGFLESCVSFCASNAAIRLVSDELSNCAFAMFDCALLRTRVRWFACFPFDLTERLGAL